MHWIPPTLALFAARIATVKLVTQSRNALAWLILLETRAPAKVATIRTNIVCVYGLRHTVSCFQNSPTEGRRTSATWQP